MDGKETTETTPGSRAAQRASTRAAILRAAREAWSESAYEDIGLRDIAGRVGVSATMVNRYFGTKEGLFREAIGTRDPSPPGLAEIDRQKFGPALAALLLGGGHDGVPGEDGEAYDPLRILLRSAASHAAHPVLRDYLEATVIPPLTRYFGTTDTAARERAVLTLSLVLGMNVLGNLLASPPTDDAPGLREPPDPHLQTLLAAMLQAVADTPSTANALPPGRNTNMPTSGDPADPIKERSADH
ncbi:TetR/AcrR family transcriptional regulator [Microbispora sp. GKU 823]|uniref:TetR/AcrR family transcriptional regulator n=1 Tax=Microbispora sp. GKU 823 TaxID=1652100 RepID=UPI0009CF47FA|nr:TetR/AcrR family transcriptional regulator [Microbispora sp. GKU 823]OPG03847.1 hypothetical protein B1L11_39185 [Microbispora sp. GKU 823]